MWWWPGLKRPVLGQWGSLSEALGSWLELKQGLWVAEKDCLMLGVGGAVSRRHRADGQSLYLVSFQGVTFAKCPGWQMFPEDPAFNSFRYTPSGIVGSCGNSALIFRNWHTVFHSDCTILLYCPQQCAQELHGNKILLSTQCKYPSRMKRVWRPFETDKHQESCYQQFLTGGDIKCIL